MKQSPRTTHRPIRRGRYPSPGKSIRQRATEEPATLEPAFLLTKPCLGGRADGLLGCAENVEVEEDPNAEVLKVLEHPP